VAKNVAAMNKDISSTAEDMAETNPFRVLWSPLLFPRCTLLTRKKAASARCSPRL
jgi:hypothetical protein